MIVVRHGATFPDQADTDPLNFDNIAAQRNLNDKGKTLAKTFCDALRQVGVPVGTVYTSKYNRAYETAVLARFKNIVKTADLTEGGLVVTPNENARRAKAFLEMIGTPPVPGTNTIYHAPAEHCCGAREGLVRREGRRGLDFPRGERRLQSPRPGADGRMASHCDGGKVGLAPVEVAKLVGSLPTSAIKVSRLVRRRRTTVPSSSRRTTLQTFLPRSMPSTAIRIQ